MEGDCVWVVIYVIAQFAEGEGSLANCVVGQQGTYFLKKRSNVNGL